MAILRYFKAEDGKQRAVYTLDDPALEKGLTKSYLEICEENLADGQSCDYQRNIYPAGPYIGQDGVIDFRSYMRDAYHITQGENFDRWGASLYEIGVMVVNKLFDDKGKLVFQEIRSNADSGFMVGVKIGLTIVASVVIGPMALQIGQAIVGAELAAAYPALASAVGNLVIQTAATGGDIEKAATNVAASYIGAEVGSFAEGISDSALIGKVASGATKAIVSSGDPLIAMAGPVISDIANSAIDALTPIAPAPLPVGDSMFDDFDDSGGTWDFVDDVDWGFDDPISSPTDFIETPSNVFEQPDFSFETPSVSPPFFEYQYPVNNGGNFMDFMNEYSDVGDPTIYTFGGFDETPAYDTATGYHDPVWDDTTYDNSTPPVFDGSDINLPDPSIFLPDFQVLGGVNVPTTAGGTDWGAALAKLGTIALQVYQQQHNPNIKAVTSSVRLPDGSVQTVQRNGTVITTSPTGQSTTSQLPPGQPYRFPDGTIVMNNGNGTYTRQTATGQVSTAQYTATNSLFSGAISAPVMLAGAALLLFALRK